MSYPLHHYSAYGKKVARPTPINTFSLDKPALDLPLKHYTPRIQATPLTTTRFLIHNLQTTITNSVEQHPADFCLRVDLISSEHSLYDLVVAVFTVLRQEQLTADGVYTRPWKLDFKRTASCWRGGEQKKRAAPLLAHNLCVQDHGTFQSTTTRFQVVVVDIGKEIVKNTSYPKIVKQTKANMNVFDTVVDSSELDASGKENFTANVGLPVMLNNSETDDEVMRTSLNNTSGRSEQTQTNSSRATNSREYDTIKRARETMAIEPEMQGNDEWVIDGSSSCLVSSEWYQAGSYSGRRLAREHEHRREGSCQTYAAEDYR
jgi:hypothetical protein